MRGKNSFFAFDSIIQYNCNMRPKNFNPHYNKHCQIHALNLYNKLSENEMKNKVRIW